LIIYLMKPILGQAYWLEDDENWEEEPNSREEEPMSREELQQELLRLRRVDLNQRREIQRLQRFGLDSLQAFTDMQEQTRQQHARQLADMQLQLDQQDHRHRQQLQLVHQQHDSDMRLQEIYFNLQLQAGHEQELLRLKAPPRPF
jgi:hypothetical protein